MAMVVLLAGVGPAAAEPVELIVNGGFETPGILPHDHYTVQAGSTLITGWTVASGTVDLVNPSCVCGLPYEGQQWLDLNGELIGGIEQSFATDVGQAYELSFRYSNNPTGSAPQYLADVTVTGNSALLDARISHSGSTHNNMNYQLFSDTFVADSSSTTLRFQSLTLGRRGIALDAVSVVIPEPSALILLAVGAAGLMGYGWRRRSLGR